ncbi:MAG TPA: hypothetical protein VGX68_02495 [Thermoanaerobaculia bacterium]|jgi:hypothetical protein|nr:hypothetical protein [Thermoanaerobaculia bacterium]
MNALVLTAVLLLAPHQEDLPKIEPLHNHVVAEGKWDVDRDGRPDDIKVVIKSGEHIMDPEPCAGCGDRVEGRVTAVVSLQKGPVETPLFLHEPGETLWFWNETVPLALKDYNGDGRIDFNLGQFVNSNKWEYRLFTIHPSGEVAGMTPPDQPEIYVAEETGASTPAIEAIPGGIRFRDFGNAGEHPGWWVFTCRWLADGKLECNPPPDEE